jgi:hypothetical protein
MAKSQNQFGLCILSYVIKEKIGQKRKTNQTIEASVC